MPVENKHCLTKCKQKKKKHKSIQHKINTMQMNSDVIFAESDFLTIFIIIIILLLSTSTENVRERME